MRFKAGEIAGIDRQAATGGNDGAFAMRQFFDDPAFPFAKGRFAVLLENIGNVFAYEERTNGTIAKRRTHMNSTHRIGLYTTSKEELMIVENCVIRTI